ncbi:MAG: YajD family HNH nuclease [Desulfobulbaceae bacterium]|nr:YajD family HNH nuclease [Desulfobulbaceae bacterium]
MEEGRRVQAEREKSYRERALKLYPWVCGKCGREFAGKKVRELTVHHRDHNHDNNPPDGSNWELLCIYCHDNEHSRGLDSEWLAGPEASVGPGRQTATHNPFAALGGMLSGKKE